MKSQTMRTSFFFAATTSAVVALVGACSDGSEQLPGGGTAGTGQMTSSSGSGTQPTTAGTSPGTSGTGAGSTSSTGGVGNTTGGVPTSAGTGNTMAGTGSTSMSGSSATGGSGGTGAVDPYSGPFKILVLSTTLDFPHDSIPICALMVGIEGAYSFENDKKKGANLRQFVEADSGPQAPNLGVTPDAMMPAGTKPGSQWTADLATDDLAQFTEEGLKPYSLIFSCNPTGTVFSANSKVKDKAAAMTAFQKFVENGGAWAGVHSATDFEKSNGFPWFTNILTGAYFVTHDGPTTQGTIQAQSAFTTHPVLKGIPANWSITEEWYYMNRDVSEQPGFQILARLASDNRPVHWFKEVGKGRSFYTIQGHKKETFEDATFRKLVLNGILWATHRLEQ